MPPSALWLCMEQGDACSISSATKRRLPGKELRAERPGGQAKPGKNRALRFLRSAGLGFCFWDA